MNNLIYHLAFGFCGFLLSNFVHATTSCECPKLGCDACSVERGVKFYTEKCGAENERVRSCARPTCVPIDIATQACPQPPAAGGPPRTPIVVLQAPEESGGAEGAHLVSTVGKVRVIQGSVSIVRADGQKSVVQKETELHEADIIQVGPEGAALVNFNGGNKLHVHADSEVAVKEFKDAQTETSRRVLLHLIKGKIRNQVEQKYNGKTSYYRVQSKEAVAGVRGTDFVMIAEPSWTQLETLRGEVSFSSLDEKQGVTLNRGEGARFSEANMGTVYKLSDEQLSELDRTSRVELARLNNSNNLNKKDGKNPDDAICEKPKAHYNQCVWKCTATVTKGESCTNCVRQRCNGNGQWAEDTRLSGTETHDCPTSGFLVRDCDY